MNLVEKIGATAGVVLIAFAVVSQYGFSPATFAQIGNVTVDEDFLAEAREKIELYYQSNPEVLDSDFQQEVARIITTPERAKNVRQMLDRVMLQSGSGIATIEDLDTEIENQLAQYDEVTSDSFEEIENHETYPETDKGFEELEEGYGTEAVDEDFEVERKTGNQVTNFFINLWESVKGFFVELFNLSDADAMVAPGNEDPYADENFFKEMERLLDLFEKEQANCSSCDLFISDIVATISDPSSGVPQQYAMLLGKTCETEVMVNCSAYAKKYHLGSTCNTALGNEGEMCPALCMGPYPPCGVGPDDICQVDAECSQAVKERCLEIDEDCTAKQRDSINNLNEKTIKFQPRGAARNLDTGGASN